MTTFASKPCIAIPGQPTLAEGGNHQRTIEHNTRIVDDNVKTIGMLLLQECAEVLNALRLADVKRVEFDRRVATILDKDFGILELLVAFECLDGLCAALLGSGGQVDEEWSGLERRLRVLQRELANWTVSVYVVRSEQVV